MMQLECRVATAAALVLASGNSGKHQDAIKRLGEPFVTAEFEYTSATIAIHAAGAGLLHSPPSVTLF